jgi:predicted  nucleic acid-binding Zn-ribbon protein
LTEIDQIEAALKRAEAIGPAQLMDPGDAHYWMRDEVRNALALFPALRERIASLERSDLAADLRICQAELAEARARITELEEQVKDMVTVKSFADAIDVAATHMRRAKRAEAELYQARERIEKLTEVAAEKSPLGRSPATREKSV